MPRRAAIDGPVGPARRPEPVPDVPTEQRQVVEIPMFGLDCHASSFGVDHVLVGVEGVERATAKFHDRRATARIDPETTSREALIATLGKRGVTVK